MDIEATYQRGFESRCHGQYEDAKKEFAKVLASDPTHLKSLHQLALIMGFEGDFDGSRGGGVLECVVDEDPY